MGALVLSALVYGSLTLESGVGFLSVRKGAGRWGLGACGDRGILLKSVMLSLAAAEWTLFLKPETRAEEGKGGCQASLPSAGPVLLLLQCGGCWHLSLGSSEASLGMHSFFQWLWPSVQDKALTLLEALSSTWETRGLTIFLPLLLSLESSWTCPGPHQLLDSAAGLGFLGAGILVFGASSWICGSLAPPGGLFLLGFLGGMELPIGSDFSRAWTWVESFELFLSRTGQL